MKREWHLFVCLVRNYASSGVYMKQTEGHNFCVDFTHVVQTTLNIRSTTNSLALHFAGRRLEMTAAQYHKAVDVYRQK
jgi:transcription elongation factor Elf1